MIDKEVILAFVNGPGSSFAFMVVAFFAMIVALAGIRAARKDDFQRGKETARREGLENLQASIARLVHDQQELKNRIGYGDTIVSGE